MALSFPRTDFIRSLPLYDGFFELVERQEVSRTAGGVSIVRDLGPGLWRATYITKPMREAAVLALEADLSSLRGGLRLFEGHEQRRPLPASDAVSTLAGVTVSAIAADRRGLRLEGLPAGFVVTVGDGIAIGDVAKEAYRIGGVLPVMVLDESAEVYLIDEPATGDPLYFHRALETVTASADGVTPWIAVEPAIYAGVTVGDDVVLRYPSARFMLERDSVKINRVSDMHRRIEFSGIQVIE